MEFNHDDIINLKDSFKKLVEYTTTFNRATPQKDYDKRRVEWRKNATPVELAAEDARKTKEKKVKEAMYGEAEVVQIKTPEAFAKWFNLGFGQPNFFYSYHMKAGENLYAVSLPNDGIEAMIAVPPHGREIHGADKQNNPLTPEDLNLIRAAIGEQIPGFNA